MRLSGSNASRHGTAIGSGARLAIVVLVAVFVALGGLGAATSAFGQPVEQPPDPPAPTTPSTTATTKPPVTTKPPAPTTTVERAPTTTKAPTSTTVAPTTAPPATEPPSTIPATTAPAVLVPGTDDSTSKGTGSTSSGMSNEVKVGLIVGGLVAVGALIGGLTYAYWRHTRPDGYLEALDVLGEASRGSDGALVDTTPVGATVASPSGPAETGLGATATVGTVGASGLGAVAAERASSSRHSTTAQTQAFRIVGPVNDEGPTDDASTDEGEHPTDPAPSDPTVPDDAVTSASSEPVPVGTEDPPGIVTLEDLFGTAEPESALGSETARRVTLDDLFGDGTKHAEDRPPTSS